MDYLRQIVSGPKIRYIDQEYNLDFTYVCPRIVAMSYPASGVESIYRNPIDNVDSYEWEDHHSPPINILFKICQHIENFLNQNNKNVVLIHCLAGKGRTGTVICCYLLYTGRFKDPNEALKYYGKKRFQQEGLGVNQPCQIRYINYFWEILTKQNIYPTLKLIKEIRFIRRPRIKDDGCKPYYEIMNVRTKQVLHSNKKSYKEQQTFQECDSFAIKMEVVQMIYGDVLIRIRNNGYLTDSNMFRIAFNTAFIPENNIIEFKKNDLSPSQIMKDKSYPDDFSIVIIFDKCGSCKCTSQTPFEKKCLTCMNDLIKEKAYWDEIYQILSKYQKPSIQQSKLLLFGDQVDDIEQILHCEENKLDTTMNQQNNSHESIQQSQVFNRQPNQQQVQFQQANQSHQNQQLLNSNLNYDDDQQQPLKSTNQQQQKNEENIIKQDQQKIIQAKKKSIQTQLDEQLLMQQFDEPEDQAQKKSRNLLEEWEIYNDAEQNMTNELNQEIIEKPPNKNIKLFPKQNIPIQIEQEINTQPFQNQLFDQNQLKKKDLFNINVVLRIRGLSQSQINQEIKNVQMWQHDKNEIVTQQGGNKKYQFDKIYNQETLNEDIFNDNIKNLVNKSIEGYNTTILAYGQTDSGKTYTLFGDQNKGVTGLAEYSLKYLFKIKEEQQNNIAMVISVSYLEIYNENVFDLLSSQQLNQQNNNLQEQLPLKINEINGNFIITQLSRFIVSNEQQALQYLLQGNQNKSFGYSYLNRHSSRAHTVFRVTLAQQNYSTGSQLLSEFNIVDLAGSEQLSYQFGAQQQNETKSINISLFYLQQVITSLCNKIPYIPYRDSSLTKVLQNSFGGNAITSLICTISPLESNYKESKKTLQFGQIAKNVQNIIKKCLINLNPQMQQIIIKQSPEIINIDINLDNKKTKKTKQLQTDQEECDQFQIDTLQINYPNSIINKLIVQIPIKKTNSNDNTKLAFIMHAHGADCVSQETMTYVWPILQELNYKIICVDFPGFGLTPGQKLSSRTENHFAKNGAIDFLYELMKYFQVNNSNQALLVGYDWGASVALAFASKYQNLVSNVIAFHPSWTCDFVELTKVQCWCLLLWVPAEQLHSIQQGEKINKVLKNSQLVKLKCGKFSSDKPVGYYSCLSDQINEQIKQFLQKYQPSSKNELKMSVSQPNNNIDNKDYKIETNQTNLEEKQKQQNFSIEENKQSINYQQTACDQEQKEQVQKQLLEMILNNQTKLQVSNNLYINNKGQKQEGIIPFQDQKNQKQEIELDIEQEQFSDSLQLNRWAVASFIKLLQLGQLEQYYQAYLFNLPNKPKAVKLFMSLPTLLPNSKLKLYQDLGIWPQLPKNHEIIEQFPEYLQGRQILVKTNVIASIREKENYMVYEQNSKDCLITYRASIIKYLPEEKSFLVAVDQKDNQEKKILKFTCNEIYRWNRPTNFNKKNNVYFFEDQIKCKYDNALTKAKLLEAALSIRHLVGLLDFEKFRFQESADSYVFSDTCNSEAKQMQEIQQQCVENILSVINLTHLVHVGIDLKRFTSMECGKLAYNGQGNCHALASTCCAFLLPFQKALGLEIRFRAGSVIMNQRDCNADTCQINPDWDGKPRSSEDHTWVDITYHPTLLMKVIDLSSMFINQDVDFVYCYNIGYNIKDNKVCNSNDIKPPKCIFKDGFKVEEKERKYINKMFDLQKSKLQPINFGKILSLQNQL